MLKKMLNFELPPILFSRAEPFVQFFEEGITSNISVKFILISTDGPAGNAV